MGGLASGPPILMRGTPARFPAGEAANGALLPNDSERERWQTGGFVPFAKPSGKVRFLREADNQS